MIIKIDEANFFTASPPFKEYYNLRLIVCQGIKLFTFISNVDSLAWKDNATAESIYKRVTSKVKPGSIVLFHNDAENTPEALPNILKTLKDQGYEFVFIDDLIYKDNYEIKHDGTQCKKN